MNGSQIENTIPTPLPTVLQPGMRWIDDPGEPEAPYEPTVEIRKAPITEALVISPLLLTGLSLSLLTGQTHGV